MLEIWNEVQSVAISVFLAYSHSQIKVWNLLSPIPLQAEVKVTLLTPVHASLMNQALQASVSRQAPSLFLEYVNSVCFLETFLHLRSSPEAGVWAGRSPNYLNNCFSDYLLHGRWGMLPRDSAPLYPRQLLGEGDRSPVTLLSQGLPPEEICYCRAMGHFSPSFLLGRTITEKLSYK